MASAMGAGIGQLALGKAIAYAGERQVFKTPIGAHQASRTRSPPPRSSWSWRG